MAPLTDARSAGGTRGQLMLVTGLTLAALIVVLALVLNAVIYTENYATRESHAVDGLEALRYEQEAADGVAQLLVRENNRSTGTYSELKANVSSSVSNWSALAAKHGAVEARSLTTTVVATTNGTRIAQDDPRNLTNVSATSSWTLANDVTAIGQFTMTVNRSSLVSPTNTSDAANLTAEDVYTIILQNGSHVREIYVYEDSGAVTVRVANSTGELSPGCSVAASNVTIDLVNKTVGGAPCSDLDRIDTLATPHDVAFRDGVNAAGTYDVVVDQPAIDADTASPTSGDDPYGQRILYDVTIEVRYVTPGLKYVNSVRIPGGDWP